MQNLKENSCVHNERLVNGCNTHLVLKVSDIDGALSEREQVMLNVICKKVATHRQTLGKNARPSYYVCNTDEPYAEEVEKVILEGERRKGCEEAMSK